MASVTIYFSNGRPVMRNINRTRTRDASRYQAAEIVNPEQVPFKVAHGYAFVRQGGPFENLAGADATTSTIDETNVVYGNAVLDEQDNVAVEEAIVGAVSNPAPYIRRTFPPFD